MDTAYLCVSCRQTHYQASPAKNERILFMKEDILKLPWVVKFQALLTPCPFIASVICDIKAEQILKLGNLNGCMTYWSYRDFFIDVFFLGIALTFVDICLAVKEAI